MKYIMECSNENDRLEFQERIEAYHVSKDLLQFDIDSNHSVLDAGCGSGAVTRYISHTYRPATLHGCDISYERLEQAKQIQHEYPIHFYQSSLEEIKKSEEFYDRIVCRFVFEYLPDPLRVTKEFHRLLKPGGKVCLIDLDGMLFNLHHDSTELKTYLKEIEFAFNNKYQVDLFVGRKLRSYLHQTGFKRISHSVRSMFFEGEELQKEIQNFKIRFENAHQMYDDILGKERATHFKELYLAELNRDGNVIFYNNFSVIGEK